MIDRCQLVFVLIVSWGLSAGLRIRLYPEFAEEHLTPAYDSKMSEIQATLIFERGKHVLDLLKCKLFRNNKTIIGFSFRMI